MCIFLAAAPAAAGAAATTAAASAAAAALFRLHGHRKLRAVRHGQLHLPGSRCAPPPQSAAPAQSAAAPAAPDEHAGGVSGRAGVDGGSHGGGRS